MKSAGQSLKLLAGLGVAIALALSAPAASAQGSDRYAAYVIDARTNEVLLDDQADEGRFPASLTKMMTLYMLFEALERGDVTMNTRLTASRNAARQPPSRLGLRRGDVITVEQAINALVVQSANDVAVLVAERLGGSEARFSAAMTTRARELGMTNSHFVNASGLPDTRQRSTAHDMAVLAQALWRDFPEHYHYFQTPSFSWRRGGGRNHNHLLGQVEGVDGIKTGYTRASGFNLASSAERGGRRVIVVVMGGETAAARDAQVAYLIEGAFEEFARREQPGATRFVGLQSPRLDGGLLAPQNAMAANTGPRPLPPSPYQVYQGMVVETLSPVRAPIENSTAQGDQTSEEDQSTQEE